jgi:hypothetical protein
MFLRTSWSPPFHIELSVKDDDLSYQANISLQRMRAESKGTVKSCNARMFLPLREDAPSAPAMSLLLAPLASYASELSICLWLSSTLWQHLLTFSN